MGTPEFAVPSLEALINVGHEVVVVVTAPDKPAGRSLKIQLPPVKLCAERNGLALLQPENLKDAAFIDRLKGFAPEVGVVVAFRILPPEVFTIPRLGCINLHASLLPELRGAAPINWALIRGITRTGVTTFLIEQKVDTGNVFLQGKTPIFPDDDAGSLSCRLSEIGAQLMIQTLTEYGSGAFKPRLQTGIPSFAPKITPELCRINWEKPAGEIHNLVRGLSPSPTAYSELNGKRVKVYRTRVTDIPTHKPGTVLDLSDGRTVVACGGGGLEPLELQMEGRRRMTGVEFFRGVRLAPGTMFQ
jgi:methionyl-tRNA formyltransferase